MKHTPEQTLLLTCFGMLTRVASAKHTASPEYAQLRAAVHAATERGAPDLLAALEELTAAMDLRKLTVRKDYALLVAHAGALKAIRQYKGGAS